MRTVILAAALLALLAPSPNADHLLDVQLAVGLGGVFRIGTWTPVTVTVTNLGSDVAGLLAVRVDRPDHLSTDRSPIVYERELELASGTSKWYSFILPLASTFEPLVVTVTADERPVHRQDYQLAGHGAPGLLIVVLSRRPNLDFLLQSYNTPTERLLDIAYPLPELLPSGWHGYSAADLVVVHDARLHDLSPAQVEAIRDWVSAGGRLVVSAGAHLGPVYERILGPVADVSVARVTPGAVGRTGLPETGIRVPRQESGAELAITEFRAHGARVTRIALGAGEIVLLPFDYSHLASAAPLTSGELWAALLGRAGQGRPPLSVRQRTFESELFVSQLSLPVYRFPSRLQPSVLAAVYLTAAATLFTWLSRGPAGVRLRFAAPILGALIVLVSAVGHLAVTEAQQPRSALALTVEQVQLGTDDGRAVVTRDTALFSRVDAEYRLSYGGSPLLVPVEAQPHRVRDGQEGIVQFVTVDRWGSGISTAQRSVPLDITARVTPGSGHIVLNLTNRSDLPVARMVALAGGLPQEIGHLRPGETGEYVIRVPGDGDLASARWTDLVPGDRLVDQRAQLLGYIARRRRMAGADAADLLVVGWTGRPLIPLGIPPEFGWSVDLHVLVMRIELPRAAS